MVVLLYCSNPPRLVTFVQILHIHSELNSETNCVNTEYPLEEYESYFPFHGVSLLPLAFLSDHMVGVPLYVSVVLRLILALLPLNFESVKIGRDVKMT